MKKKADIQARMNFHIAQIVNIESKKAPSDFDLQELRVQYMAVRTLLWAMESKEDAEWLVMMAASRG